ncbi:MAG: DUF5683 domain-containing protein [bacterium]
MRLAGLVMILLLSTRVASQVRLDSLPPAKLFSPDDSLRAVPSSPSNQSVRIDTVSTVYHPAKLPGVALALSAILPGAGQFYNESYWKIPILLGFGYYFASRWIDNNDSTKQYRELYTNSFSTQTPTGIPEYQRLREFYKDQRDTFSWYIFIYYIVNLVDAYVDASLYDFNVGDNLSIHVRPDFDFRQAQSSLNIKISF